MRRAAISFLLLSFPLFLRLYPAAFRDEFGDEMISVLTKQVRAAAAEGVLKLLILSYREFSALANGAFLVWLQLLQQKPAQLAHSIS